MKFQIDGTGTPHPTTIDFDTSFDEAARKALHIQGLVPPAVEGFSKQERRCEYCGCLGTSGWCLCCAHFAVSDDGWGCECMG